MMIDGSGRKGGNLLQYVKAFCSLLKNPVVYTVVVNYGIFLCKMFLVLNVEYIEINIPFIHFGLWGGLNVRTKWNYK